MPSQQYAISPSPRSDVTPYQFTSIAKRNRHTGKPHEHKREIARRQRQAARQTTKAV